MSLIVCQNLTKTFGDLVAVDNLNLSVAGGELFGFLGPNGAGKTTSIKMMTGLLKPTSGTAHLGGFDIQQQPLEARRVFGYIPDNPFLYEKLSGREYLQFMADLYEVPKAGRVERITDLLALFELQDKGSELIQGYSRGMRQKIAMAGALIHNPKVMMLDEPTVGLDPKGARTLRDILKELCRRGVAVLISTHILGTAEQMCDRVAIVNKGKIIAQGTVAELRTLAVQATPNSTTEPSLEDIFLQLTGDTGDDVLRYLG